MFYFWFQHTIQISSYAGIFHNLKYQIESYNEIGDDHRSKSILIQFLKEMTEEDTSPSYQQIFAEVHSTQQSQDGISILGFISYINKLINNSEIFLTQICSVWLTTWAVLIFIFQF